MRNELKRGKFEKTSLFEFIKSENFVERKEGKAFCQGFPFTRYYFLFKPRMPARIKPQ